MLFPASNDVPLPRAAGAGGMIDTRRLTVVLLLIDTRSVSLCRPRHLRHAAALME
jgi:hypothetical protein